MYITGHSERLIIRPITKTDAPFILRLLNTDGWLRFIGDRKINNIESATKYIAGILENPDYFFHVFSLKQDNAKVGIITYIKRPELPFPDIGFAMLPEYEKLGLAFEASMFMIAELRQNSAIGTLLAITIPENEKSIKLLLKLGMTLSKKLIQNNLNLEVYEMKLQ